MLTAIMLGIAALLASLGIYFLHHASRIHRADTARTGTVLYIILGSALIAFAVFFTLVWVLLVPVLHVPA